MNVNSEILATLYKTLRTACAKSKHLEQMAALIYNVKTGEILHTTADGLDSGASVLYSIRWYTHMFNRNLVIVSTHSLNPEAIQIAKRKHIQHIYYFNNLNTSEFLAGVKKFKIPATRLIYQ